MLNAIIYCKYEGVQYAQKEQDYRCFDNESGVREFIILNARCGYLGILRNDELCKGRSEEEIISTATNRLLQYLETIPYYFGDRLDYGWANGLDLDKLYE